MVKAKKVMAPTGLARSSSGSAYVDCDKCGKTGFVAALFDLHADECGADPKSQLVFVAPPPKATPKEPKAPKEPKEKKEKKRKEKEPAGDEATEAGTEEPVKEKKAKKAKKATDGDDKPKDKKPVSGFFRFSAEYRAKMKEESPEMTAKEVTTGAGAAWKALSEEEKKPYNDAYAAEMEAWRERNGKPAKTDEPKVKKVPGTGYMLFTSEKRSELKASKPELKTTEIMQELGQMWKALPEDVKNAYNERVKALKEQAKAESADKMHADAKPEDTAAEPADDTSANTKPAEGNTGEDKLAEPAAADAKPAEDNAVEDTSANAAAADAKPAENNAAEDKPAEDNAAADPMEEA